MGDTGLYPGGGDEGFFGAVVGAVFFVNDVAVDEPPAEGFVAVDVFGAVVVFGADVEDVLLFVNDVDVEGDAEVLVRAAVFLSPTTLSGSGIGVALHPTKASAATLSAEGRFSGERCLQSANARVPM